MKKFIVMEEWGETAVEAINMAKAASEYVEDQYHGNTRTMFVDVVVFAFGDRITRKRGKFFSFAVQPDEPRCSNGEHQWENGPIFASGPIVAHTDTCSRCGMRRRTENYGQNPEDGTQGHRIVEYIGAKLTRLSETPSRSRKARGQPVRRTNAQRVEMLIRRSRLVCGGDADLCFLGSLEVRR